jgi:endonuclease III
MPRKRSRARASRKPGRPRASGGSNRAFRLLMGALCRAYGRRRRLASESALDRVALAVLAEGRGERAAARYVAKFRSAFVDWNELRVARPRDMAAAAPDAPEERVKKLQHVLQALYEGLGGLILTPLLEKKPTEARAWLTRMGGLAREEVDAVQMIALGTPLIPASDELARVLRRLGVVPRRATRARAQRTALKGLAPEEYREFYSLVGEHAATVCHAEMPECARCKLKRYCKSKGRW